MLNSNVVYKNGSISLQNATYIGDNKFIYGGLTEIEALNCSYIGPSAFYNCSNLTTANFPVCTTIGSSAFYECSNLTSISFPNCTCIRSWAFRSCSSLTTADFSNNVYIEHQAFIYCTNLTTANFPVCTTIGQAAFSGCSNLTTISFPNCMSIGSYAFQYCSSLTTASFPNCTYIGASAFESCKNLTTADFPLCTYIYFAAFRSCSNLTTASFPNCLYIGSYAFQNCSSLTTVSFSNCTFIEISAFAGCSSLTTASFPVCTYVGDYAFSNCSNLTTASFPNCLYIGSYAFQNCSKLTSISFPLCTVIGNSAFMSCSITGPLYFNSLLKVFPGAFYGLCSVTEIHFRFDYEDMVKSLSNWSTAFGWGSSHISQIFFDIGGAILNFSGVLPELASIAVDGKVLQSRTLTVNPTIQHKYFLACSGYTTYMSISPVMSSGEIYNVDVDLSQIEYKTLKFNVTPSDAIVEVKVGGLDIYPIDGEYRLCQGCEYSFTVACDGYKTQDESGTLLEDVVLEIELEEMKYKEVSLQYPFTDEDSVKYLSNVLVNNQFDVYSGKSAIRSGSSSYNVNNGTSYGYITFTTPDEVTTVVVKGWASSESNYDFGFAYIGTKIYKPTESNVKNNVTDGTGTYMMRTSGSSSSASTYTFTAQPNTTYYLNLGYVKDSSVNNNDDRVYFTEIDFVAAS